MKFELTQRFYFEAAHTLERLHGTDSSLRVHGHTYHASATVSGPQDPGTGMVVDLAVLRAAIADVRELLDHRLLDEVPGLGTPTLENLCLFISRALTSDHWVVEQVQVKRPASGDSCRLLTR
jgi:6-pyruvoyltetrahydropterin/6-carboxytetrahydropterin synthase